MSVPRPKPRITRFTVIIGGAATIIITFLAAMLGGAMDFSIKENGKVDATKIGSGFKHITSDMSYLFSHISDKNSYVPKMAFLSLMCIAVYFIYKYSEEKKRLHRKGTEYGSAKWGDENEMKSLAEKEKEPVFKPVLRNGERVFDDKGRFIGFNIDNNIILSKEVKLSLNTYQHNLNLNVMIIGDAGSGKTRYVALPNICQLNTSYVITDPKGEILANTGKMLTEAGYKIRVFNLIQMKYSNNYNPFEYVYDYEGNFSEQEVIKMIEVLFSATKGDGEKDDFWSQKGRALLEAIVFLLFEESIYNAEWDDNGNVIESSRDRTHLNFFSITEKMRKLMYPPRGSTDGYFMEREINESDEDYLHRRKAAFLCPLDYDFIELESRNPDSLAIRLYKEIRQAPEETGQSFLSSANVKTFMFNLNEVENLTCCDNIQLETIGDEKTALFIIVPAKDKTFSFLVTMLYTQMFDVLQNRANFKYANNDRKLPVHVRCIMDEFCNIPQIPDFDETIAFVRSMNVSLNVIIQTLSLFKAKYEKTWEAIIGCCSSILFLGGNEDTTKKYISESLGKETIDIKGRNRTKGARQSSTNENNQIIGRELLQPNEVGSIPIDECILIMRSHNPFYCKKYPLEKHPNYSFLALSGTDKERAEKQFQISSITALSVKDVKPVIPVDININEKTQDNAAASYDLKVDTNINAFPKSSSLTENVLIDTFSSTTADILSLFESKDIRIYGEEELLNEVVEYSKVHFEFDSYDLGEPMIQGKEEITSEDQEPVTPDILNPDGSISEAQSELKQSTVDTVQFNIPDTAASPIEDLSPELIDEAVVLTENSTPPLSDLVADLASDGRFDDISM